MNAGIKEAIRWIAEQDDSDLGCEETGYLVTICLVADLFGKTQKDIAQRVANYRKKAGI